MKSVIAAAVVALAAASAQAKDIVDTAVSAGEFKTLAAALEKAGLVQTLKGQGPFTVFAPTDAAFAKVPKAQLDALLADKTAFVGAAEQQVADVIAAAEKIIGQYPEAAGYSPAPIL